VTQALFVTGTDTGIGKTHVAVALLRALAAAGLRAVGMKPVAAGTDGRGALNADVAALLAAGNVDAPHDEVNPYCFEWPIAPHVAARMASTPIDLALIERRFHALAARADIVVVEGAGGALVPLSTRADMLDVALRLRIAAVLVVGVRLGCINHALLTASAMRARGVPLAGWIANRVDPAMRNAGDSIEAIGERIGMAPAADIAYAQRDIGAPVLAALGIDCAQISSPHAVGRGSG